MKFVWLSYSSPEKSMMLQTTTSTISKDNFPQHQLFLVPSWYLNPLKSIISFLLNIPASLQLINLQSNFAGVISHS